MKLIKYLLLALFLTGCKGCDVHSGKRTELRTIQHTTRKLKAVCSDNGECKGGYAVQDNSGAWFVYWFLFNQSYMDAYRSDPRTIQVTSKNWERQEKAPEEEEVEPGVVEESELTEMEPPVETAPDLEPVEVEVESVEDNASDYDQGYSDGTDSSDGSYSGGDDSSGDYGGGDFGGGGE